MTRRTISGTVWGIVLTISFYLLSVLINFSWGFGPSLSVGAAIVAGGLLGMIIGSNEMALSGGALTGGVVFGLIFTVLGSFTVPIGNFLLFFIQGALLGAVVGIICALFVQMVSFS